MDSQRSEPNNPSLNVESENLASPSLKVNKKFRFFYYFVFLLFIFALALFLYKRIQVDKVNTIIEEKYSSWINCSDVRSVIEEGNSVYASCLGGVLVVDKNTGKVIDQIGEPDGLSNGTTTSLIKKGQLLYIGTQDGLTIFDLNSRSVKKISVNEGLVNGANIHLKEDGDKIWVGTFKGLSLLDTKTNSIKNFTKELADNSTIFSVNEILVTNNSVYFIILANSGSQGSIARYDKATDSWERFGPQDFGVVGEYARIDFARLEVINDKIFLSGDQDFWVSNNTKGSTWKKIDLAKDEADIGYITLRIIAKDDSGFYLIHSNGKIYKYFPENDKLEIVYGNEISDINLISSSFIRSENTKVWFRKVNKDNPSLWLSWLDLKTKQIGSIVIQDRPVAFKKLIALIDDNPIVFGEDSNIWKYNSETKVFSNLFKIGTDFPEANPLNFDPIVGTAKIFMTRQGCGMGCDSPVFFILDYADGLVETLEIPENVIKEFKQEGDYINYPAFKLVWKDIDKKMFAFQFSIEGRENNYLVVDLSLKSIKLTSQLPEGGETTTNFCNPSYVFVGNGNKFNKISCSNSVENQNYSWRTSEHKQVFEKDKTTGIEKEIYLSGSEEPYSSFGSPGERNYYGIMYVDDKVYVWGNRGLNVLDTKSGVWKLIDTNKGLLRNEVLDVLAGLRLTWTITNWGGLSSVPN